MENPYESPRSALGRDRPPRRAVFEVGTAERHVVEVFLSLWGTEVYVVDDVEVLRLSSMSMRATRQFDVGESERHSVEIRLDVRPSWKSLIFPDWRAEAYVDGKLVVAELFPETRRIYGRVHRVLNYALVTSVALLVLVVLLLAWVSLFSLVRPIFSP
jgi:hypothetical protein